MMHGLDTNRLSTLYRPGLTMCIAVDRRKLYTLRGPERDAEILHGFVVLE